MQKLKYGENPHQSALIEVDNPGDPLGLSHFKRLDGSPFIDASTSVTTLKDVHRGMRAVAQAVVVIERISMKPFAAVVMKHGSPCGGAFGNESERVLAMALRGDSLAAFGGFVVTNFSLSESHAGAITESLGKRPILAGIAAPAIDASLESLLSRKTNRCHLITNGSLRNAFITMQKGEETVSLRGVRVTQSVSSFVPDFSTMARTGARAEICEEDLAFAWALGSVSASNTITLVNHHMVIGNGVGQQDRVGACELALWRAQRMERRYGGISHGTQGAVAYSDSFFPFPDGIEVLGEAGVIAVFATSGSVRDAEVFEAARRLKVLMYTVPDAVGRGFYH